MVDANRDGFIDKEDLKDMYASLGTISCSCCIITLLRAVTDALIQ